MKQLSDAELIVPSKASQRADGAAEFPGTMKSGAAKKIAARLIRLKLVREVLTRRGMPEWRKNEAGRAISLVILRAGREAIGVVEDVENGAPLPEPFIDRQLSRPGRSRNSEGSEARQAPATSRPSSQPGDPRWALSSHRRKVDRSKAAPPTAIVSNPAPAIAVATAGPRVGAKQALVIGMLSSPGGASLDALANATGWLAHTTRAALTGLRRRGYAIERQRNAGGASIYRIGPAGSSSAAAA